MAQFVTDLEKNKGRADVRDFILFVDEPMEVGGTDKAPNPTEYLLIALASCMGITMKMYADRKQWNTGLITVNCDYSKDELGKNIIIKKVKFENAVDEEQENRLITIGSRCPVSKMIGIPIVYVK